MSKIIAALAGCAMLGSALPAQALSVAPSLTTPSALVRVADGCGWGAWRGPWGHCRNTAYSGPLPDGGWMEPMSGNGCPPGWWRGPYGHCRNTPFHGRLPDGSFQ